MAWLKGLAATAAVAAAAAGVMFYHLFNLPNERGTEVQLLIEKGAEMGRFKLGSTAIVLFRKSSDLEWEVEAGDAVKMGQEFAD